MKQIEVTEEQFYKILHIFQGYIFNRQENGKFFVKPCFPSERRIIKKLIKG
jgi:hypothetical protein